MKEPSSTSVIMKGKKSATSGIQHSGRCSNRNWLNDYWRCCGGNSKELYDLLG